MLFGQSGACLGLHLLPWFWELVPGDQVRAPVPQPPKREARRVLQDEVVQHSDGGAHRPAPEGGVYAHSVAEHSGVSVCVCIAYTSLNSLAGDLLYKSVNYYLYCKQHCTCV